jgi:pyroglutamyl-peptidase
VGKHVLVTGFEPFSGGRINPSEQIVRTLDGHRIAGRTLIARIFPVEARSLRGRLEAALRDVRPDIVVCLGQASGRTALSLERVAVNILDFSTPDNAGITCAGEAIARGGPDARLSNLPVAAIAAAWAQHEVPGYVSNTAGTYVCNQLLYEALAFAECADPPLTAGFIHLPSLPAQAIAAGPQSHPSMSLDLMKKGIEVAIETIVAWIENSQTWIPRGVKEVKP